MGILAFLPAICILHLDTTKRMILFLVLHLLLLYNRNSMLWSIFLPLLYPLMASVEWWTWIMENSKRYFNHLRKYETFKRFGSWDINISLQYYWVFKFLLFFPTFICCSLWQSFRVFRLTSSIGLFQSMLVSRTYLWLCTPSQPLFFSVFFFLSPLVNC